MPEDLNPVYDRSSEELNELISAPPSWILRSGITVILVVIVAIIGISAFIHYPDIVKTTLKINSLNSPKPVVAKRSGKLVRILVKDKQQVEEGHPLAFIESTASHTDVIRLEKDLLILRSAIEAGKPFHGPAQGNLGNIGELQGAYQIFYQTYLQFRATQSGGNTLLQRAYILKDLEAITESKKQILQQQDLQQKEYANAEEEYKAYSKLAEKGLVSRIEYKQQQNKYFSSKVPLQQTEASLLANSMTYQGKKKELSDLNNAIIQQQQQFMQALNGMINETETWLQNYVLSAPVSGSVAFAGIVQENQNVITNQELFIVNPGNTDFFGEVQIPQYNMGKIKEGQRTLIKMRSFPFEEFGIIEGRIGFISDVAYKDSVFIAKIDFKKIENKDPHRRIVLKSGMMADAEIITEESSLLQRFTRNVTKMLNSGN